MLKIWRERRKSLLASFCAEHELKLAQLQMKIMRQLEPNTCHL